MLYVYQLVKTWEGMQNNRSILDLANNRKLMLDIILVVTFWGLLSVLYYQSKLNDLSFGLGFFILYVYNTVPNKMLSNKENS